MWSTVWTCVFTAFRTIYSVMNTIKIYDVGGAFSVSLWDLSLGVIVIGAVMNLFINFTIPTMPDRWDSGVTLRARKRVYAPIGRKVDNFFANLGAFY